MKRHTKLKTALLGTAATAMAVASLGFGTAIAQDDEEEIEMIVVTGSRIAQPEVQSVSPLLVTLDDEIALSGYTRIEDLMNSLPQVETGQNSQIVNGSSGTANLDLRGMGAIRTLVLMNGRRLQPGGVFSSSPDINIIPSPLVKRIETVTGGAGAVYGADAVAGVVNFILDDSFEGIKLSVGTAIYQHNNDNTTVTPLMDRRNFTYPTGSTWDGQQYTASLVMGGNFADGRGNAVLYATWRKVEALLQGARDFSSCAISNAGTSCGGSANAIIPNFFVSPTLPGGGPDFSVPSAFVSIDANSGWIPDDGTNRYNYAPVNHFQRPDEKWSIGGNANYDITDSMNAYMEVSFMRDITDAQIAESGTFFAAPYDIPLSSPLFPQGFRDAAVAYFAGIAPVDGGPVVLNPATDTISVYIGKRNVEGGPRASLLQHAAIRMVGGLRGDLGDSGWTYDASMQYGSTTSQQVYVNDFFAPKIVSALDVVLDANGNLVCSAAALAAHPSCIPYDVFRLNGVTPAAAASVGGTGTLTGTTRQYIGQGYITGDLGITLPGASNPIAMVLGVEYRKEVFERVSDEVMEQGLLLGQGGPTVSISGENIAKEIFTEINIPIVEGADMMDALTLELGGRYSDFDRIGGNETYKVGLSYEPTSSVKFRAGYNRAVRAPTMTEQFTPQNRGLWSGTDGCSGATPVFTAAQCANTGVTAAQYGGIIASPAAQYNAIYGGNPNLQPEIADTYTIGMIASPMENFRFSVDYWNIDLKDVIATVPPQVALNSCATLGTANFCNLITRAGNGSLWQGGVAAITATNVNLAAREQKGVDVTADYEMDVMNGTLAFDLVGTMLLKKFYQPVPGQTASDYECKGLVNTNCFPSPKWRHSLRATYTSAEGDWRASIKWRYFGKVTGENANHPFDAQLDAQSYFDIAGSVRATDSLTFTGGINNLLDKEPPIVGGTLGTNANTYAGFYDTLGRYLHINATVTF